MARKKEKWIIAISCTETDGVLVQKFDGTENQIKRLLVKLVKKDKAFDKESFDYGTECIDDVQGEGKFLEAYAVYNDYHIDYTAIKIDDVQEVTA